MECKKIIFAIVFAFLCGCGLIENHKIGFYDYSRLDYEYRLPLLKPYEITSSNDGSNWLLINKLRNPSFRTKGVQFLSQVGIKDSIIVLYSPRDLSFSSDHPQIWTVLDLKRKSDTCLFSSDDYYGYLSSNGIDTVLLYDINLIFKDFDAQKKLPPEWNVPSMK